MISTLILSTAFALQQPGGGQFMPSWKVPFPQDGDRLIAIQDLDGDGADDWLHADGYVTEYFDRQGALRAISGKTGEILWQFFGPAAGAELYVKDSDIVDLDGDGRLEILLSFSRLPSVYSTGRGRLFALDSVTGQVLWQLEAESEQLDFSKNRLVSDLDGDGVSEILSSSRGQTSHSVTDNIYCYQANGSLRWQHELEFEGSSLEAADLDGDGTLEVILPDGYSTPGSVMQAGTLTVLEGADGQQRWQIQGMFPYEHLGSELKLQDLDSDGATDILAIGPQAEINSFGQAGTMVRISAADGQEVWRLNSNIANEEMGRTTEIADLDRNGIAEIILGRPNFNLGDGIVQALESTSGSILWQNLGSPGMRSGFGQRILIGDYQNTGTAQVLVEQSEGAGLGTQRFFNGWQLLDGANGRMKWRQRFSFIAWADLEYQFNDLNRDGASEIIVNCPVVNGYFGVGGESAGLVFVLDSNGLMQWLERGVTGWQNYGKQAHFADLNADGNLDLVISALETGDPNTTRRGQLEARDGLTGDLLWRVEGQTDKQRLGFLFELYDLDHDGVVELISRSPSADGWSGYFQGEVVVMQGSSGDTLWRRDGNQVAASFAKTLAVSPDVTGDGWDEVVLLGNSQLISITGQGNFHGFLTASRNSISASAGGAIDLQLNFTEQVAYLEYRVVFSGHGTGLNYEFGIPIPLVLDHWLYLSEAGGLPSNHLRQAEGALDARGLGAAQIQFAPGEIPNQMVGLNLTFAALARFPWDDWDYCSIPISISIQP
jgi:outer membrane protein assembly factor BamB